MVRRGNRRYEAVSVPAALRNAKAGLVASRYDRETFDLDAVQPEGLARADLLAPGHPLHDAIMSHMVSTLEGVRNQRIHSERSPRAISTRQRIERSGAGCGGRDTSPFDVDTRSDQLCKKSSLFESLMVASRCLRRWQSCKKIECCQMIVHVSSAPIRLRPLA